MGEARRRRTAAWALLLGATAAGRAEAAGYALREQSATALGNAFAGSTAGAEDASYMFFNPAALGRLDGFGAVLSLSYVAPRSEVEDADASTVLGTPIGGRDSVDDIGENALLPALYLTAPVGDRVRLGVGFTAPFGLATEYPEGWVGRYHAVDTELRTYNINPALAVRVTDWLSLGAGFQAQYADGELTNAVDFGTIGFLSGIPGAAPAGQDGFARLQGDDWAFGWNAGLLAEPVPGTRLGVAYRSEIEHRIEGDVDFTSDTAGIAATLRAATGAFADSDAHLDLETPATLSFGVHQAIGAKVAVMAEATWTDWSAFDEIRVEYDNAAQPDTVTTQDWEDSWFFALGATWKPLESLTLRTGVAYDQTPTRDRARTPRIPDEDRYWLALGVSWQPVPWLGLDAGYTHIFVDDSDVDLGAAPGTENQSRGSLRAQYENSIDIVTVGARLRF